MRRPYSQEETLLMRVEKHWKFDKWSPLDTFITTVAAKRACCKQL